MTTNLGKIGKKIKAVIERFEGLTPEIESKLVEFGICEGTSVFVLKSAPIFGDPISINVDNRIIAIRKKIAAGIIVRRE